MPSHSCSETKVVILEHPVDGTTARALNSFASRAQRAVKLQGEVNIRITSSRELQELNRRFRRKNKPTDVLSFPSSTSEVAGDIAISAEIAASSAAGLGHSAQSELKILMLHGMLHLAGYDHETDAGEMASREAALRLQLGLPTSLIERSLAVSPTRRRSSAVERQGRRK